jgi:hypothetical protein
LISGSQLLLLWLLFAPPSNEYGGSNVTPRLSSTSPVPPDLSGALLTPTITVYNKWHETELERWLSDHNVPYPSPADRKDLENLVKDNWQSKVATPYNDWDVPQLQSYLKEKGVETKDAASANKEGLVASVKEYWYEAEDKAEEAWSSVKDWIFDR